MKKKFLIKMFSAFVALALVNSSVTLAKVKQKSVEQADEKKLSPKEQKEKEIKTIKEVLKKYEFLEEQIQKKMLEKFKDFKKEDYELKDYDLRVLKKNNVPILFYTHKKTGAQIYFNLNLDKEKIKNFDDELIFRASSKNDSGLIHFAEHCLAAPFINHFIKKLKLKSNDLNARTSLKNLVFVSSVEVFGFNEQLEKEYIEKLAKELTSPSVFEKEDKTFEIEKKRILNEEKDNRGNFSFIIGNVIEEKRNFNVGGEISKLEKITLNDFKKFYEKYINPSNCLLIKHVFELNPQKIKDYLNLWNENYFSRFEKKEIKDNNFELKNKEKYLYIKWPKNSNFFKVYDDKKEKYKECDYDAKITFDENFLNATQRKSLEFPIYYFKNELDKFLKDLGYEKGSVFLNKMNLFGNDKKCFTQKALEKNTKKIMNFVAEKLKNLDEEEYLCQQYNGFRFWKKDQIEKLNSKESNSLWTLPGVHLGIPISFFVKESFNETKKTISDKFFMFKDKDELEFSRKVVDNYLKQNLKSNLNAYKVFAEKGAKYFDIFEKDNKKTIEQMFKKEIKKYGTKERVLPIKFKEKSPKKFVKDFSIILLANFLDEELNYKRGLVYKKFIPLNFLEDDFLIKYKLNNDSVNVLEDYFSKNFNEIMKNVKITKKDLDKVKKKYKENFNSFKEQYKIQFKDKDLKVLIKDLKRYAKTGEIKEDSYLRNKNLTISNFFMYYPSYFLNAVDKAPFFTLYEDFKEFKEYFEREMAFREKYSKKVKDKITPEFVKDFLENLFEPAFKKIDKAYKLAEKKLKALDSIKLLDVKNLIKTAYLVENKEEIEKVNKNEEKIIKAVKNFKKKFSN